MRYRVVRNGFVALVLCLAASSVRADKLEDYLAAEMIKRRIPGLSVAVVREGKVVIAKGFGVANVELAVSATENTVYELASVTKQFTATAIMMLVEEGKVSLDEKITKYLADLPTAWGGITVRHLLNHTSGITSYTATSNFGKTLRKDFTKDEIIKLVADAPLEFQPGAKWKYSNTGYFLLGMMIEKVSGKGYGEFLNERIFKPLGMTSTRLNSFQEIIKNRSSGYSRQGENVRNCEYTSPTQPFAAGALVSTVTDMAKWDAALYTDKLLKKASLEQMWTPTKLTDGKTQDYGFGWELGNYRGHRQAEHGGGIPGFSTNISRFLDDKLTVILLANLDSGGADELAKGVVALYIPALAEKSFAGKPDAEKNAKTTQILKDLIAQTAQDKADPNLFTPEARAEIFPDKAKAAGEYLKTLGPLSSVELLSVKEEDKNRHFAYKLVFKDVALICNLVLTPDDKIAAINLRPEQ